MFKKIIVAGATAGLLLVSAAGAFACESASLCIVNADTSVSNSVTTLSNTGGNYIHLSEDSHGGSITTGGALSLAGVQNQVNYNNLTGDLFEGSVHVINVDTNVGNTLNTQSNTGNNYIHSWDDGHGGNIVTGSAGSISSVVNVVNTNLLHF